MQEQKALQQLHVIECESYNRKSPIAAERNLSTNKKSAQFCARSQKRQEHPTQL